MKPIDYQYSRLFAALLKCDPGQGPPDAEPWMMDPGQGPPDAEPW